MTEKGIDLVSDLWIRSGLNSWSDHPRNACRGRSQVPLRLYGSLPSAMRLLSEDFLGAFSGTKKFIGERPTGRTIER